MSRKSDPAPVPDAAPQAKKRDPAQTRKSIMLAARQLLAHEGRAGFTLSDVSRKAGVNRGTTYFHFPEKDLLISAVIEDVSQELSELLYGDANTKPDQELVIHSRRASADFALFFIENSELGIIWMAEILSKGDALNDPLWRSMRHWIQKFAESPYSQPGLDADVMTLQALSTYFLWPLVIKAKSLSAKKKRAAAERLAAEVLRQVIHGSVNSLGLATLSAFTSED